MTGSGKGDKDPLQSIIDLIEKGRFSTALSSADAIDPSNKQDLHHAGRLSALRWYCRYCLDDDIEAAQISDDIASETRADYLSGFAIQFANLDALHLAEPVFERLVHVAPDIAYAWHGYGLALLKQEYYDEAADALERAKSLDATNVSTHYLLGDCYGQLDKPDKAAAAYQAFLELEPDDIDALVLCGMALSNAEQFDKAIETLERAIAVAPGDVSPYFNLAIVALRTGDAERLTELETQISRLAPDDPRLFVTRAINHESRGEIDQAWDCIEEAFSCALKQEDWPLLDHAVERALAMASKHNLKQRVDPWIDNVFNYSCFSRTTLEFVREFNEPLLAKATCFGITVEGRIPMAELDLPDTHDAANNGFAGYMWSMSVAAKTENEARQIAMDFDRRCGRDPIEAEVFEVYDDTSDFHQGVYWCQSEVGAFPLKEGDA